MSLGLAAGLHGAALAYALSWSGRAAIETKIEDVVTVEIVDAAMLEDMTAPEPPTDKLPSAAAKASDAVPEDAAPERMPVADAQIAPPAEMASAAPELGEAQRETVTEAPPPDLPEPVAVEPVPAQDMAGAMQPTARETEDATAPSEALPSVSSQSAGPSPVPPDVSSAIDTPPPAAEPRLAMAAPMDEAPAVAVAPPAVATESPPETRPDELIQSAVANQTRKSIRRLRMAALAARPFEEAAVEALRPRPKAAEEPKPKAKPTPKRVAKLEPEKPKKAPPKKAEPQVPEAEKAAKKQPAKGKQLAALAVEGEGTANGMAKPSKTKAKLKGSGRAGAKSGQGTSGATTSGQAGIGTYWNSVRAKVARNKGQNSSGRRGTVVVTVGVTRSGGLQSARISQSSGIAALDQAALAAVRRSAPFPPPPAGAPASMLFKGVRLDYR